MKFSLAGVLGYVLLATDDEGPSSPRHATRRKIAIKAKRKAGDKNTLVSADRPMEADHIDLTRGANPMQTDGDQTTWGFSCSRPLWPTLNLIVELRNNQNPEVDAWMLDCYPFFDQ
ncbi:hypothetical protein Fot_05870 [Forsythia ovata]|uniref:Uncharacterized protein n=1 Tax=Forsythia ovata TaxID=205694 RepID=A0ABD1WRC7_9LAMI